MMYAKYRSKPFLNNPKSLYSFSSSHLHTSSIYQASDEKAAPDEKEAPDKKEAPEWSQNLEENRAYT